MCKKTKLILALSLVFVLSLSGLTSAFAEGLNDDGALIGTQEKPAEAALTKLLQFPEGTKNPGASFTFAVSAISVDGDKATETNMPAIKEIILNSADKAITTTKDGVSTIVMESDGIFSKYSFANAGVYVYEITEIGDTYKVDAVHEMMIYSDAKYEVTVYVKDKTGSETGTYVAAITTEVLKADSTTTPAGIKVDPTPGGGEEFGYSQMTFTNTYIKTNGGDPNDPDPTKNSTLSISKTVSGEFASSTVYFDYTLDLLAPSLVPVSDGGLVYHAYVIEDGKVVTEEANGVIAGTDSNGQAYLKIVSGTQASFSLKDKQTLVFINTPVGTTYKVTEVGTPAYTPSFIIITDGKSGEKVVGTLGASLSTDVERVGESVNSADFNNDRGTVTPTGLNLNDLPFIAMIAIATVAAIVCVAVKTRKRYTVEATQIIH
ncbi:MAG: hypothetical protein FWE87_02100 [Coriobacteriia bacterium]|nr:hypothetical protein [Coriobacteriia bacterium]